MPGESQSAGPAAASPAGNVAASGAPATQFPGGTTFGRTSVTEFEFRQAVQTKKQVLVFLLDAEADWPSSQFDAVSGDGEGGNAIAGLRQEIGQQYLVGYFRTPEELASLVSAAIYRVEMNRQMNLESLHVEVLFSRDFARGTGPVADSSLISD